MSSEWRKRWIVIRILTLLPLSACGGSEGGDAEDGSSDTATDTTSVDDGGPLPGLPDENCPGVLDPRRVYAVAQVEELGGGLAVLPLDDSGEVCVFGWRPSSGRDTFEHFLIAADSGDLLGVYPGADEDMHVLERFGLDVYREPGPDGVPREFQDDPYGNDEIMHEWECPFEGLVVADPSDATLSWSCHDDRYDLDDRPLPLWQNDYLTIDHEGNLWGWNSAEGAPYVFTRTSRAGDVETFEPPRFPDGSARGGDVVAARSVGAGGWAAIKVRGDNESSAIERWSFGSAGIEIDGEHAVDVRDPTSNDVAPVVFDAEGTLFVLFPADTFPGVQQEILRVPLGGEPQSVIATTPSPDAPGQLWTIHGLVAAR